jgi:TolB-like protein
MAGEIFISYRRADEALARLLHDQLRAEGVEAWYDVHIGAGQDWRVATAKALQASRIFVLLFSQAAAESEDIAKELAAATFSKKLIVPVRIENIQPTGAFLYELASRNWVNAFENTEANLAELARSLAKLVKAGVIDESIIAFDRNAGAKTPAQKQSWLKRNLLVIAAAVAVVMVAAIAALYWLYPRPPAAVASLPALPRPAGISIAVLPFLNLSSDKDQEFFSDGITEEITAALAKVPGLTVIGRTSAFQFKGENKDMRAIGQALGAKNLIEGSVRKAGNQVRITAQLINAADGTHVWTESYDRKLTDIFAVQEDIATAISGALRVPLGLAQGERLVPNRTTNIDSYQDYLRARTLLLNCRCLETEVTRATTLLEQVVARDPSYAPAWGLLASAYGATLKFNPDLYIGSPEILSRLIQSLYDRMEKAAHNAIRLDKRNTDGYTALGDLARFRGQWAAGEDYYRQALILNPNDDNALSGYAGLLARVGRFKDARRMQAKLFALEPLVPEYNARAPYRLLEEGRNDEVIKTLEAKSPTPVLAYAYAAAGRYAEAADTLMASTPYPRQNIDFRQPLDDGARLIRSAPAKVSAPDTLPTLGPDVDFVYLYIGAESRSLEFVERGFAADYFHWTIEKVWWPPSASLRKTERFKTFARKARLVEYWRARGWPEFCHPVGADDFACR